MCRSLLPSIQGEDDAVTKKPCRQASIRRYLQLCTFQFLGAPQMLLRSNFITRKRYLVSLSHSYSILKKYWINLREKKPNLSLSQFDFEFGFFGLKNFEKGQHYITTEYLEVAKIYYITADIKMFRTKTNQDSLGYFRRNKVVRQPS